VDVIVGVAVGVAVAVADAVGVSDAVAVGVAVGVAALAIPIPISFTFCGFLTPASVNLNSPCLNLPFLSGTNATETLQVPPTAAITPLHSLSSIAKPVLTPTAGAANSTLPLFVSVTVCSALINPAGTLPNVSFFGDSATGRLLIDEITDCPEARRAAADKITQTPATAPIPHLARRAKAILNTTHC
jgi:hypothetical protein